MRVCGFRCSQRLPSEFIYITAVEVTFAACRQRKNDIVFFSCFLYLSLAPPCSLLRFFCYFSKMMEFYRFYKYFCVSGDLLVAKSAWQQRPAHVRLEQGFLLFQHFLGSKKVFFSMCFFCLILKKQKFSLSQSHLWASPFSTVFFNHFDEISKMRVRGAPKILKNQLVL